MENANQNPNQNTKKPGQGGQQGQQGQQGQRNQGQQSGQSGQQDIKQGQNPRK